MNAQKITRVFVIVLVLFWIVSTPTAASGSVHRFMTNARSAGNSMITFTQGVVSGDARASHTHRRAVSAISRRPGR